MPYAGFRVLEEEKLVDSEDLKDLIIKDMVRWKLTALVSCNVERTFSQYTVKPRFTNASDHEQFGLRTNFPNTKRLGWRTVSRDTNTQAVNIVER
jgi:hypothetical protein